MSDLVGRTLGQYEIVAELGHGGMANVYRAIQPSIGREVAIKVLPGHFLQDRTFLERFNREVRVIAKLQHPRILPVYDYGEAEGLPYIVMAYMPGGTLAERIKKSGPLPLGDISRLLAQIAEGLDYAHEQGIVHRDFKPSNVLLDAKGNAYLSDFGIAKVTADTAQLTGSALIGTPAYMAPEMSRPGGVSPQIDVYALGVTLYQMVTGQQPYLADTPIGVLMAHATEPIPDARLLRPGLPGALQAVIEMALAKNPADRYSTAEALAADFQAALAGEPVSAQPAADDASTLHMPGSEHGLTTPVVSFRQTASPTPVVPPGTLDIPSPQPDASTAAKPARRGVSRRVAVIEIVCGVVIVAALLFFGISWLLPQIRGEAQSTSGTEPPAESSTPTASGEQTQQQGSSGSQPITIDNVGSIKQWKTLAADGEIYQTQFSPDGLLIAASLGSGAVGGWEVGGTGEMRKLSGSAGRGMDFSPDGSLIAAGDAYGKVTAWDVATGDVKATVQVPDGPNGPINVWSVAFSPDGKMLASTGDNEVVLWDTSNGDKLRSLDMGSDVYAIAWSTDSRYVFAGADNAHLYKWEADTGQQVFDYHSPDSVLKLAVSPDGKSIAAGLGNGEIKIWDIETGDLQAVLSEHSGRVIGLSFDPQAGILASTGDDNRVLLWDYSAEKMLRELSPPDSSGQQVVSFSPDGTMLAYATTDHTIVIWTVQP